MKNLTGQTVFETERLICRRWLPTDAMPLYNVYADEVGARWVDDGKPITRAECDHWLEVTDRNYATYGYGMFALEERSTKSVVGFCGLVHPGGQADAEVKYALLRASWGLGLASEAIPGLLGYGVRAHGLTKVIATVAPQNGASQRVLLKSGMTLSKLQQNDDGSSTQVYVWYPD